MRRRRKRLAWGTFCPTCRTVYRYPECLRLACDGDYRAPRHDRSLCDVVEVYR